MHRMKQQTMRDHRQAEHAIGHTEVWTGHSKSPPHVLHQNDLCVPSDNAGMSAADADRHSPKTDVHYLH